MNPSHDGVTGASGLLLEHQPRLGMGGAEAKGWKKKQYLADEGYEEFKPHRGIDALFWGSVET
jgi:hypothetical protein